MVCGTKGHGELPWPVQYTPQTPRVSLASSSLPGPWARCGHNVGSGSTGQSWSGPRRGQPVTVHRTAPYRYWARPLPPVRQRWAGAAPHTTDRALSMAKNLPSFLQRVLNWLLTPDGLAPTLPRRTAPCRIYTSRGAGLTTRPIRSKFAASIPIQGIPTPIGVTGTTLLLTCRDSRTGTLCTTAGNIGIS